MTTLPNAPAPAAALACALLLAQPAGAAQPASKTFRDWLAACDNTARCAALSLPAETADNIAFLRLDRPAGPDAAPTLTLNIRAEKLRAPLALRLMLDQAPFPAGGQPVPAKLVDAENAVATLSATDAEALLAAARKATKLTFTLNGKPYAISLSGSVAALLWIDDRQGRIGTTTALIRRGAESAAKVPAAPALPVIVARPTPAGPAIDAPAIKPLAAAIRKGFKPDDPEGCDSEEEAGIENDAAWPLEGGATLVGLACSRGAYNVTNAFWIVPKGGPAKPLSFPRPEGGADTVLVNAEYAPQAGTMSFFAKGRGIGDCGASGSYAWNGTGFVLTAYTEMAECRGLPPEDWLTLWRSEVRTAK